MARSESFRHRSELWGSNLDDCCACVEAAAYGGLRSLTADGAGDAGGGKPLPPPGAATGLAMACSALGLSVYEGEVQDVAEIERLELRLRGHEERLRLRQDVVRELERCRAPPSREKRVLSRLNRRCAEERAADGVRSAERQAAWRETKAGADAGEAEAARAAEAAARDAATRDAAVDGINRSEMLWREERRALAAAAAEGSSGGGGGGGVQDAAGPTREAELEAEHELADLQDRINALVNSCLSGGRPVSRRRIPSSAARRLVAVGDAPQQPPRPLPPPTMLSRATMEAEAETARPSAPPPTPPALVFLAAAAAAGGPLQGGLHGLLLAAGLLAESPAAAAAAAAAAAGRTCDERPDGAHERCCALASVLVSLSNPVCHPWVSQLRRLPKAWPETLSEVLWPGKARTLARVREGAAAAPPSTAAAATWPLRQDGGGARTLQSRVLFGVRHPSVLTLTHPAAVVVRGRVWRSAGHFFHAMKLSGTRDEEEVRCADDPGKAAAVAARPWRHDWDRVRDGLMEEALRAKMSQDEACARYLLSTYPARLVCVDADPYWGVDSSGYGTNRIGLVMKRIRAEMLPDQ